MGSKTTTPKGGNSGSTKGTGIPPKGGKGGSQPH